MESWCSLSNSTIWGDCSCAFANHSTMKIFILAQTQELQLPSPLHQEHFYCHQRHFRHLPQLQRARKRQPQQELSHQDSLCYSSSLSGHTPQVQVACARLGTLPVSARTASAPVKWLQHPHPSSTTCSQWEMEQRTAKGILFSLHMQQLMMLFPNPGTALPRVLEMLWCESTRETMSCWALLRNRYLTRYVLSACHTREH